MQGLQDPLRALRFDSIWDNTVTLLKEELIATEAFGEVYIYGPMPGNSKSLESVMRESLG